MKKFCLILMLAGFAMIFATACGYAKDDDAFIKLGRGLGNIVTGPGEIYAQPVLLTKDNDPVVSAFGGFFKGIYMFLAREMVGVYDLVTFPVPFPSKYRPLIEPPTTFTNWDLRRPEQGY